MARLIIISSIGLNNEIGKSNQLIWSFKEDLQFFKEKTINHKVVMGYKTFLSLPKLLIQREHLVLTSHKIDILNVQTFNNFPDLQEYLDALDEDVYIIGGRTIYQLFLPYADEMLLTKINAECREADTYFPDFNIKEYDEFILKKVTESNIDYKHVLLRKKKV